MKHKTEFKGHNILGRYCWTCRKPTEAGIPGWTRSSRSDHFADTRNTEPKEMRTNMQNPKYIGPNPYNNLTSIVWANGDTARGKDQTQCRDCEKHCGKPVDRAFDWGVDPYNSQSIKMLN